MIEDRGKENRSSILSPSSILGFNRIRQSKLTYDFFASGACCSMTLTTLPGYACFSNCSTKYLAFTGSPLLSN